MGLEPKRVHVTLTAELAAEAGFAVATCRHLGNRQQGAIELEMVRRGKARRQALGEDWLAGTMSTGNVDQAAAEERISERAAAKRESDPEGAALDQWPPDLVCEHTIKAFDGTQVTREQVAEWLEEGPHPDVTKAIALPLLRTAHLVPETEGERGEGSGGSSDSSPKASRRRKTPAS